MTTHDCELCVEKDSLIRWLATGEVGASSMAIVRTLCGLPTPDVSHPLDPSDLRLCLLLLEACPSLAARFDEMRAASPTWAAYVDAWPKLKATLEEEEPSWRELGVYDARRTYRQMHDIRNPI